METDWLVRALKGTGQNGTNTGFVIIGVEPIIIPNGFTDTIFGKRL